MMIMRSSWITSPVLLLLRRVCADQLAACYLPSGEQASDFYTCNPYAYIANCCPTGWTCYSNSMCVITDPSTANESSPIGTSIRGGCTNPEWNNALCGDYCLGDQEIDGRLKACGDDKFCCEDDPSCSCTDGAFHINPGRVQTIIGIEGLEHTETSTIAVTTSIYLTGTVTFSTITTTTASGTSAGEQTPSPTVQTAEKEEIDKLWVKAVIAVCALLGFALLAGTAWYVYRRFFSGHRWRKEEHVEVQQTSAPPGPIPTQDPYVRGNAASVGLDTVATRRIQDSFDRGDAPLGNAYERDIPSPLPLVRSTTPARSGFVGSGQNETRGPSPRPLSFLSEDDEEARYVRPRAYEL